RRLGTLRDSLEQRILGAVGEATVIGGDAPRLWSTSNIAFAKLEAEAILLMLSERGVCASAGAACSSGSMEPSTVLLAMGLGDQLVAGSIRFSLSRDTTAEEIDRAIEVIVPVIGTLRATMAAV
ncbi:MAG: aminotransferase class V-fold PLP-dependent enzyme, partial [Planctomycetota bacterium]|nr:aminotransferase class V-fold PLP-dependent enzyme [Planctomycetota bacterium]